MDRFGGTYGWVFGQIRVDPNSPETVYIMGLGLSKSTDGGKTCAGPLRDRAPRRPPRPVDRPQRQRPPHQQQRRRRQHLLRRRHRPGGTSTTASRPSSSTTSPSTTRRPSTPTARSRTSAPTAASSRSRGRRRAPRPGGRRFSGLTAPKWELAPGGEGTLIAHRSGRPQHRLLVVVLRPARAVRVQGRRHLDAARRSIRRRPRASRNYRGQWLAATMLSPHNPQIVYHGFQYLFRSMNRGETWERISPDLTYNNPDQQGRWPFAIPFATITAVDESPFKFGLLYAGTDDGRVWVTKTSGDSWTEITAGLPYNKHVWKLVASKYDPATVYVTLIGRHDDDFNPYIFKSADHGKTWVSIAEQHPRRAGQRRPRGPQGQGHRSTRARTRASTSAGTRGKTWNVLGGNLPTSYVWDLAIHPRDNALVIATNGRGMWIVDDLAPVQNAAK
ncbi:MAG: hypothetical protein M0C28_01025 [Candidatus Moduliflexus flocculans]|nr:hypothetical protein [Candidatus Moduliflexus flocculans]